MISVKYFSLRFFLTVGLKNKMITMINVFILLIVVSLTTASLNEIIEQMIPGNVETENITACSSKFQYDLSIYEEPMTWHEALKSCTNKGFNVVEDTKATSLRRDHVRTYLKELRNKGTNTSLMFWTGLFRSEPAGNVWYKYKQTGDCIEYNGSDILQGDIRPGDMCSIVEFDMDGDSQVLKGAFCNQSFPYICHNYRGLMAFHSYTGVSYISSTLPDFINEEMQSNISKTLCLDECLSNKICNAFTYNHTAETCTTLLSRYQFGASSYTIKRTQQGNVTHYLKAECNVSYYSGQLVAQNLDVTGEFPVCEQPVIDQCICNSSILTSEEITAIVQERIQNLTVDPKKTSAHHRTLISAPDYRSSSRLLGTFATLFIVLAVSIPIILDIFKCININKRNSSDPDSHEKRRKKKPMKLQHDENV